MKNSPSQKIGQADLLVGRNARPHVPTQFRLLLRGQKFAEAIRELWPTLIVWLTPRPALRRYRVTPRANGAAFRHALLRSIQLELRRTGLVNSSQIPGHTSL